MQGSMAPALSGSQTSLLFPLAQRGTLLQQRRVSNTLAGPLNAARRPCRLQIAAHASSTAEQPSRRLRPGEKKGFVEEMRMVAMRLHTKDQAPKEGKKEPAAKPIGKLEPTREGYLRFLVESKQLFGTMEDIMQQAEHPDYARFQNTGLERAAPLQKDIEFMQQQYGLDLPEVAADGPGSEYSQLLQRLAKEDPPAFICHYYNVYFAHSAGGRMIGKSVSDKILDGAQLQFYQYGDNDLKDLLEKVRDTINDVATSWTEEQKLRCLNETEESFKYSGGLLRQIWA